MSYISYGLIAVAAIPALGEALDVKVLDDKVPEVELADGAWPGLSLLVTSVLALLVLACISLDLSNVHAPDLSTLKVSDSVLQT
jgi:hypothetical protein